MTAYKELEVREKFNKITRLLNYLQRNMKEFYDIYAPYNKKHNRRLRNATSRINTAFFVIQKQITPHRIWYNRVDKKPLTTIQERSYSDTYFFQKSFLCIDGQNP